MKKIVVVGSLNVDLVASIPRMPVEGETLTGSDFATYAGGKGANQAVAAAKLGANVAMVGRLGSDAFGDQLRSGLETASMDISCVLQVSQPTGSAVILVTEAGGNSIVVIPGANYALRPEDMDAHLDVLKEASLILAQLEIPLETVVRLGEMAKQIGVPLVLDPAPAQVLPTELLRCVTWLTPNESETRSILKDLGHTENESEDGRAAVAEAARQILATGARNVILKLGGRGIYLAGADVEPTWIASFHVNAVDTTAAGDAFNGGFAYALTQGMTPVEAGRFGCAVAAVSVTRTGAQPSMPSLAEVEALIGGI